jgi:hypothetical protein
MGLPREEEDYCSPPLAQERAAVLDTYFDDITVERRFFQKALAALGHPRARVINVNGNP